ncbi:MAG: hypothetical protein JNM76_03910 [Betaproteobacteria bacterium]|nr:hypothetical protein [Betaproteobacteria bacterium]
MTNRFKIIAEMRRLRALRYPARVRRSSPRTFEVQFIDLPEAFTFGVTRRHALRAAQEVLLAVLETKAAHKLSVPMPTPARRGVRISAVIGLCKS